MRLVDGKSIPALKINILLDMADSIPYQVPTQSQESIFPHKPSQNTWARNCKPFNEAQESIPSLADPWFVSDGSSISYLRLGCPGAHVERTRTRLVEHRSLMQT